MCLQQLFVIHTNIVVPLEYYCASKKMCFQAKVEIVGIESERQCHKEKFCFLFFFSFFFDALCN